MMVEQRSFENEMDFETDGFIIPGQDFEVTPGDSGQAYWTNEDIQNRTPASEYGIKQRREYNSLRMELMKRESRLSEVEYREYQRVKDYLQTDSEKIYYLKLPVNMRSSYLQGKSMKYSYDNTRYRYNASRSPAQAYDPFGRNQAIASGVSKGMKKQEVEGVWGRPERIDVAGNPQFENERWLYSRGGRTQIVYFENGRVNGWTLE